MLDAYRKEKTSNIATARNITGREEVTEKTVS